MLKNPNSYPRGRGKGIHTHCHVTVMCDKCNNEWNTQYSNYKRKNSKVDLCQACKNKYGVCGMLGRKHSKETIDKFSSSRSGEHNSFHGKKHNNQQKEKWSKKRQGKVWRGPIGDEERKHMSKLTKTYWDGLTEEAKVARLALCNWSAMHKASLSKGGRYSGLHAKVKNIMLSVGLIDFISEEQIGSYVVDEVSYSRKIIVEINGDYWHANPIKYSQNDIISYPKGLLSAQEVWNKDAKKIDFLQLQGFNVLVIWENDVKNNNIMHTLRNI